MQKALWCEDAWISSRYNFEENVLAEMSLPQKVSIYDVTLRDGEQQPGVVFRKEDKVKIACALDALGVHRIEAGMPSVSKDDFDAIKEIASMRLSTKVFTFCRAKKEDIDLSLACDVGGVTVELPSSDLFIETGLGWTRQKVVDVAVETTAYAKDHGLSVNFFPYDTTRADPAYLRHLITEVVKKAKVDSVSVVDTFGITSPQGFAYLVKLVKSWVTVPIEVHCHNHLGLATANALSAVAAGAEVIHSAINGMGEGAGMTSTEEVAVALKLLYGIDIGFKYEKLCEVSDLVQNLSGIQLTVNRPIVGKMTFSVESGIYLMNIRKFKAKNFLKGCFPFLPEFVGNKLKIIFGKKSGSHGIKLYLEDAGIKASEEQIDQILNKVKELSIKQKRALTNDEFNTILKEIIG